MSAWELAFAEALRQAPPAGETPESAVVITVPKEERDAALEHFCRHGCTVVSSHDGSALLWANRIGAADAKSVDVGPFVDITPATGALAELDGEEPSVALLLGEQKDSERDARYPSWFGPRDLAGIPIPVDDDDTPNRSAVIAALGGRPFLFDLPPLVHECRVRTAAAFKEAARTRGDAAGFATVVRDEHSTETVVGMYPGDLRTGAMNADVASERTEVQGPDWSHATIRKGAGDGQSIVVIDDAKEYTIHTDEPYSVCLCKQGLLYENSDGLWRMRPQVELVHSPELDDLAYDGATIASTLPVHGADNPTVVRKINGALFLLDTATNDAWLVCLVDPGDRVVWAARGDDVDDHFTVDVGSVSPARGAVTRRRYRLPYSDPWYFRTLGLTAPHVLACGGGRHVWLLRAATATEHLLGPAYHSLLRALHMVVHHCQQDAGLRVRLFVQMERVGNPCNPVTEVCRYFTGEHGRTAVEDLAGFAPASIADNTLCVLVCTSFTAYRDTLTQVVAGGGGCAWTPFAQAPFLPPDMYNKLEHGWDGAVDWGDIPEVRVPGGERRVPVRVVGYRTQHLLRDEDGSIVGALLTDHNEPCYIGGDTPNQITFDRKEALFAALAGDRPVVDISDVGDIDGDAFPVFYAHKDALPGPWKDRLDGDGRALLFDPTRGDEYQTLLRVLRS